MTTRVQIRGKSDGVAFHDLYQRWGCFCSLRSLNHSVRPPSQSFGEDAPCFNDRKYRRKIQCECAWRKERSSLSFPLKKISLCVNFASAANFPSRCLLRRKERWTFKSANSINVEVKRVFHANAIKQLRYFGFCACTEAMEKAAKKGLIKCSGALPLDPQSIIWPNCPLK